MKRRNKIRVAVIFGGKSAEHEVSLQSARNVMAALDPGKYEVVPIGIDKGGRWLAAGKAEELLGAGDPKLRKLNTAGKTGLAVVPGDSERRLVSLGGRGQARPFDVAFPVLHGPFGEDGTVQGLLKLLDVPFVGSGVLGSAVGMDKDAAKRLLRDAGLPVAKWLTLKKPTEADFSLAKKTLGLPLFVKPANLGSSVGVSKAADEKVFRAAVAKAFEFDRKVLVEEFVPGREIECSVLGNDEPAASVPGEVIPTHDFYDYEAKYVDENGARLDIPAKLTPTASGLIRRLACKAFAALNLEGMARVDFFLKPDGRAVINEVNTIPGFTNISMYPKLWAASGLPYPVLIGRLIDLALERHEAESRLKTSYKD